MWTFLSIVHNALWTKWFKTGHSVISWDRVDRWQIICAECVIWWAASWLAGLAREHLDYILSLQWRWLITRNSRSPALHRVALLYAQSDYWKMGKCSAADRWNKTAWDFYWSALWKHLSSYLASICSAHLFKISCSYLTTYIFLQKILVHFRNIL